MDELRPTKGADHPYIEELRVKYPFHVELLNWKAHNVSIQDIERRHGPLASWSDHTGARTFGFVDQFKAREFGFAFHSDVKFYRQTPIVDETVVAPEPPPLLDNDLAGHEFVHG